MAYDGSDSGDGIEGSDGESTEWLDLGRELRDEDPAIHAQALRTVRGIVAALRARKAPARVMVDGIFGAGKIKPSA